MQLKPHLVGNYCQYEVNYHGDQGQALEVVLVAMTIHMAVIIASEKTGCV